MTGPDRPGPPDDPAPPEHPGHQERERERADELRRRQLHWETLARAGRVRTLGLLLCATAALSWIAALLTLFLPGATLLDCGVDGPCVPADRWTYGTLLLAVAVPLSAAGTGCYTWGALRARISHQLVSASPPPSRRP
ncbi:hypothetical protein E0L36_02035 [Streptomyces sp. AJS327]|uniref:hypothetical protein n=1 Tax=Streptomyces sp. AJS327 TaxID=2545265 RepID=UPI0015DD55E3|nr:hypothetical protein [Streptomyces sp. AJS327]MBA0049724.1 hypothetical protein [Streptomyces sp. AJS327]